MLTWLAVITAITSCAEMPATLIAAHRGGMDAAYPENTLPAFRHAADQGAHLVELDLRATADGRIVVHHDASVSRTTGGEGLVHDLTLRQMRSLSVGGFAPVPTLQEVIDWAAPRPIGLLLDVKPSPGLAPEAVIKPVLEAGLGPRVLVGVRSEADIQRFRQHAQHLRFLGFVPSRKAIARFLDAGVEGVRLWPHWLRSDPGLAETLRRAGVSVWVTAGSADAAALRQLVELGVRGVITDRPGLAAETLSCNQDRNGGEP